MNTPPIPPEQRFAAIVDALRDQPGVAYGAGRSFGSTALTVNGKIVAMLMHGTLVVKLPRARVAALVADGQGQPFDAGRGRPMKEWVALDPAHGDG